MKPVHTIDDLDAAAGEGARLAVIGNPVAHSRSPELHQPALDAAGIDARYIRLDVPPGQVAEAFARMRDLGFTGANVTAPHKPEALEACDFLDPHAKALGSVNTVLFSSQETHGFNTDGPGFVRAIHHAFSIDLKDLRVLILGAGGGAGQSLSIQCAREGCDRLVLANRSPEKLDALREKIDPLLHDTRVAGAHDRLTTLPLDSPVLAAEAADCDLIVNATSLGLRPTDPAPLPAAAIQAHHLVYDTIYAPAETRLLANARQRGARPANGLTLLLHQGVLAFQIWHPGTRPEPAMRQALDL